MAMKSYKARGIVLGTLKYGEKGVIVHMLTDTHGRQSYMIQGVKPSAKGSKMALLQPMFAVEFEGLQSSKMSMHRMKDLVPGVVLQSTPFDIRKSTMSLFMAEVLYRLVRESEPAHELFDFVWGCVAALDAIDEGIANFHLWFLANLSRPLGFSPDNEYIDGRGSTFVMVTSRHTRSSQVRHSHLRMPAFCTICWSAMCATLPRLVLIVRSASSSSMLCLSTTPTTSSRSRPWSRYAS